MKKINSTAIKALVAFIFLTGATVLSARPVMVASVAGYKKPVTEIMSLFEKKTGIKTNGVFGNHMMVMEQAKRSGEVNLVIADRKIIGEMSRSLQFAEKRSLGEGVLVLAYGRGVDLKNPEDLATERVKSLFMPQNIKTIYGTAGFETLKSYGYSEKLRAKITEVATMPQIIQYLITGEADAGFVNLTEAMANRDRLGGYVIIPAGKYNKIIIEAAILKGSEKNPETVKFMDFLETPEAKAILKKHGLK
jgi:molybdate transport system substrate-binding protein